MVQAGAEGERANIRETYRKMRNRASRHSFGAGPGEWKQHSDAEVASEQNVQLTSASHLSGDEGDSTECTMYDINIANATLVEEYLDSNAAAVMNGVDSIGLSDTDDEIAIAPEVRAARARLLGEDPDDDHDQVQDVEEGKLS